MPTPIRSLYPKLAFFISLLAHSPADTEVPTPKSDTAEALIVVQFATVGVDGLADATRDSVRAFDEIFPQPKVRYAVRARTMMACAPIMVCVPAATVEPISTSACVAILMFHSRTNI